MCQFEGIHYERKSQGKWKRERKKLLARKSALKDSVPGKTRPWDESWFLPPASISLFDAIYSHRKVPKMIWECALMHKLYSARDQNKFHQRHHFRYDPALSRIPHCLRSAKTRAFETLACYLTSRYSNTSLKLTRNKPIALMTGLVDKRRLNKLRRARQSHKKARMA